MEQEPNNDSTHAPEQTTLSELRGQLLECFHNARFDEQLDEIVRKRSRDGHSKLSAALIHVLFDPTLEQFQPPRGSFGRYDEPGQFPHAKELINSKDEAFRKKGLEEFKQMRSTRPFSSHPLVDEWTLFAEASVDSLIQAVHKWEEKRGKGKASSEETWNLALFYVRRSDFKQALEVLQPGIDKRQAPFAHLRFALYCAAQHLGQQDLDAQNTAIAFLSKNLNKWPVWECYLAWIILEREKRQGPVQSTGNQMEHIKMWRILYNLLTQPVTIPNLENQPGEEQARTFVSQLKQDQLGLYETLILWLRDYTERYCAQFGKKERLSSKFKKFDFEMWQELSEAYEYAGDTAQAGEILHKIALEQWKIFQEQRERDGKAGDRAAWHMGEHLVKLFRFYQKNNILQEEHVFDRFMRFYKDAPELWQDKKDRERGAKGVIKELIQVTRPLLEQVNRSKRESDISSQPARMTQAEKPSSHPQLHIQIASPDSRLSWKNGEATLDISVYNPGPGKVTLIRVTCASPEKKMPVSESGVQQVCEQDETKLIPIPVIVSPLASEKWLCQVNLVHRWEGDTEVRSISRQLEVRLSHFHSLPNPYVFDRPLGSWPQDALLFQGREKELDVVRERFLRQQGKGASLYFCGMPKIGKTSLLNCLALMLKDSREFVPCVVNLKGIQASQQSLGEVVALLTQNILRDAPKSGLNVSDILPVSADDQNPIHRTWYFFQNFLLENRFQPHMRFILLLDDFDLLVASHTKDLLDLFAALQEHASILFILSGRQRPEYLPRICPGARLFPLAWRPIDLLPFSTVEQMLEKPLVGSGVQIPEVTIEQVFQHTAGHPYLVAMVASRAVERLSTERRIVLTLQDIDEIVRQLASRLAGEDSLFCAAFLTSQEERNAVIRFARETGEKGGKLLVHEAQQMLGEELMMSLWKKYMLEYIPGDGGYLSLHDQIRFCLLKKRIGIFVDYENVLPSAGGMSGQEVGGALTKYASQFGEVVCCWASADPRILGNGTRFKVRELEQAGFQVPFSPDEPQNGKARKNESDFVLVELLHKEELDIYIIVSGDGDFRPCISGLLDKGAVVHLCASRSRLNKEYLILAEERLQHRQAKGLASDFFIDDLDEVLQGKSYGTK